MRTALAGRRLGARAWCLSRAAAMLSRSGPQGTAGLMACPGEFGGLLWCVGAHQHAAGSAACTTAPHAVNKHTQHRLLNTARPRAWLGAAGGGAERVRAPRAGPGLCGGGGARRAALAGGGLGRGLPRLHALPAHRGARRPARAARPLAPMHAHLSAPCARHVELPWLAQSSRDGLCTLGACALGHASGAAGALLKTGCRCVSRRGYACGWLAPCARACLCRQLPARTPPLSMQTC